MPNHALYTLETAGWRALLGQSSFLMQQDLPKYVEDYLVHLLLKATNYSDLGNISESEHKLNELAEHCLLVSGLFPEQPLKQQMPLRYFVDTGKESYLKLARKNKNNKLYSFIGEQFVLVMDVLHQFRELCTGDQIFDPMQAYDIWQETGSSYARHLLRESSNGFVVCQSTKQTH